VSTLVTEKAFAQAFRLKRSPDAYQSFVAKLTAEIGRALPATACVLSLDLKRGRTGPDDCAREALVTGRISAHGDEADLHGRFVWEKNSGVFRGWVRSDLEPKSDRELLSLARRAVHGGQWAEAERWLAELREPEVVPPSVQKLKDMVRARI
jgi:hypothetical protein